MSPEDKPVEARLQTQHKLEIMVRYWGAWCAILGRAKVNFCTSHLWLIDTHAGRGLHLSSGDPDGQIAGTPLQAVMAARNAQRQFPGKTIHVRATDNHKARATELFTRLKPYKGEPPDGVDVEVGQVDWQLAAPKILREIAAEDHPHGGNRLGNPPHEHRSLWFIDPYGIEGIDRSIVYGLPGGSEVIINLDLMDLLRRAGKADAGDHLEEAKLDVLFDGSGWRVTGDPETMRRHLAANFAASFGDSRFDFRNAYPLRMTGSQHRAMVHLTRSKRAVTAFSIAVRNALEVETLFAGTKMSTVQKDLAVVRLHGLFAGQQMTTVEMREAGAGLNLGQIRVVCRAAQTLKYGTWHEGTAVMDWVLERADTLWD